MTRETSRRITCGTARRRRAARRREEHAANIVRADDIAQSIAALNFNEADPSTPLHPTNNTSQTQRQNRFDPCGERKPIDHAKCAERRKRREEKRLAMWEEMKNEHLSRVGPNGRIPGLTEEAQRSLFAENTLGMSEPSATATINHHRLPVKDKAYVHPLDESYLARQATRSRHEEGERRKQFWESIDTIIKDGRAHARVDYAEDGAEELEDIEFTPDAILNAGMVFVEEDFMEL